MLQICVDDDLELRTLVPDDTEEMVRVVTGSQAHLAEFLPWADGPWTTQDARVFIDKARAECERGIKVHTGIWYLGKLAGHLSLTSIAPRHKAEVAGWVAADISGKGVMGRSVSAMAEYAFTVLELQRLLLRCRTDNAKSIRMARRVGFRPEGWEEMSEHRGDIFYDKFRFALLARDWRRS